MPAQRQYEGDADDDLSDGQIRALLDQAEAERRTRAEQGLAHHAAVTSSPFRLPKLDSGLRSDNYLQTKGSIARLDQAKLVDEKDRSLANGIKKIEEPISKKEKAEVCATVSFPRR
jgi:hypothetical protein